MKLQPPSILITSFVAISAISLAPQNATASPASDAAQELAIDSGGGEVVSVGRAPDAVQGDTASSTLHEDEQISVASPSASHPLASASTPPRVVRRPQTWSEKNRGFYVSGSLGSHIGVHGGAHGLSALVDIGYQFGFGLGLVVHLNKTFFFGYPHDDSDQFDYGSLGAGLRFSAPFHRILRLWAQATYGAVVSLEHRGGAHNVTVLGGFDFRLDPNSRSSCIFLGVSGGVEYNLYFSGKDKGASEYPFTAALTLSFVL